MPYVKTLTGVGQTTQWGINGADLGATFECSGGGSNFLMTLFGDTFETPLPSSVGWRSPTAVRSSTAPGNLAAGISFDNAVGGAYAKEIIPYLHSPMPAPPWTDGQTNIPCDGIQLPDGRYMMGCFQTEQWQPNPFGTEWITNRVRFWTSTQTHGENWGRTWDIQGNHENFDFPQSGPWVLFQNISMLQWGDHIYIYGTRQARTDSFDIHLARVHWNLMWERSAYEFWGRDGAGNWVWSNAVWPTPILSRALPNGRQGIGEINARVIAGKVYLVYCDFSIGSVVTRSAPFPTGLWSLPRMHAAIMTSTPTSYAPALHPRSSEGDAHLLVSQWPPDNSIYRTYQWQTTLTGLPATLAATSDVLPEEAARAPKEVEMPLAGTSYPPSDDLSKLKRADLVPILADHADEESSRDDVEACLDRVEEKVRKDLEASVKQPMS